jgi:phospholipase C
VIKKMRALYLRKLNVVGIVIGAFALAACAGRSGLSVPTPTKALAAKAPTESHPTSAETRVPPALTNATSGESATSTGARPGGIHNIKHIVIIMQENRSFDTYFGTFPGADGIPMQNGVPTVCAYNPTTKQCDKPFHNTSDRNFGGPHGAANAVGDIDSGKMDGFVTQAVKGLGAVCNGVFDPLCSAATKKVDVMGYHDAREIPNYWTYAEQYVLQDHMFEPNASWSLPEHLFMVSAWSAKCSSPDPMSCRNELQTPDNFLAGGSRSGLFKRPDYAWTDLTWLLHMANVSWAYFVAPGTQPDCKDDQMLCTPKLQSAGTPEIWNPLPYFETVRLDGQLGNIQPLDRFYAAAKNGTLPAVSWIVPNGRVSEHPPALVSAGQAYVTGLINSIMESPDWKSTAIFLAWDDWSGFYDHVTPPTVDQNGYGLRVPGLVISPYAKRSYIDHQTLSFDAYLKFIEDDFIGGQRIDPTTDGRPDPRPDVRENVTILGDLSEDFDFSQSPRPPLILPLHPPPGPASTP